MKNNVLTNIIKNILLIFGFILLIFFTFGNVSNLADSNIINNISLNMKYILFSAFVILLISSIYILIIKSKYIDKINKKYMFIFVAILSGIYIFIQTFIIPFSPSQDANTIYSALQNGGTLTGDMQNYFNFFANNKIVMYIYLAFSKIIGDVVVSIKILNFILLYSTCILSAFLVQRLYTKSNKYITLFLCTIFIPYGLLTIPYVYQITIFITTLVLYLYTFNNIYSKIISILLTSILYILRPTTLILVLVLIFFYGIYDIKNKKKCYIRFIHILLILFVGILVKIGLGQLLYSSNINIYPNITSPIIVWTQYVGTSYDCNNVSVTGRWLHSPADLLNESDKLEKSFNKLWNDVGTNSISYEEYKKETEQLNTQIWERFRYSVLADPMYFLSYVSNKFCNLYNDSLSLYLYNPVIYNDTLMNELEYGYQEKYNLLHNSYMYIYILLSFIFLVKLSVRNKNNILDKDAYINIALMFAIFLISLIYIAMLEVSKRYTMDLYIPMLLVISYLINAFLKNIEIKFKDIKQKYINIYLLVIILSSIFGCLMLLNVNNISCFNGAKYYVTDSEGNEQILHILIPDISPSENLYFYNARNEKYFIKSNIWYEIPFYNNPKGGVALIMNYNDKKNIQIKQYSNMYN
jgi:hypothetical protein